MRIARGLCMGLATIIPCGCASLEPRLELPA
ncbi:MAG: hypothetical protein K0R70_309, partial [Steroidobacteraceae bacterium]|nr:hypothetical protein [Steroidobacteraceae bacterium]